jgi:Na+/melibiose symporter-like transporter
MLTYMPVHGDGVSISTVSLFHRDNCQRLFLTITVPIISVSVMTLYMTLHLHNPRTPLLSGLATLDWLGVLTIVSAAVLLLVGLQEGSNTSFKLPVVITLLVLGSLLSVTFPTTQWWQEKAGRDPVLPLRIFKDISNLSALSVCACDALAFNSVAYFLPLYFQIVLGRSPTITGVYMLAVAVPLATVSFASGFLIEKTGRFLEVLQAGLLIMTVAVGLLVSLHVSDSIGKIIAILIVLGIGFGPNFGAPLIALQTRVRESDIATGTAAFGFVRMIFGAIGVVAGQVVFQILITPHFDDFVAAGIAPDIADQLARGEAVSLTQTVAALPRGQRDVVRHGMTSALKGTWILYTVISGLGFLVSFGIKRTRLQKEAVCAGRVEMVDGERPGSSA